MLLNIVKKHIFTSNKFPYCVCTSFQFENNSNFTSLRNQINMNDLFHISSLLIVLLLLFFLILFFIYSVFEKEKKASAKIIPLILFLVVLESAISIGWIGFYIQFFLVVLFVIGFIVILVPFHNKKVIFEIDETKFDERDIMFSRMELKKGTNKFETYYKNRPQNKAKDNLFRKEAGLLSPDSMFYDPILFNAAAATFSAVDLLHPLVETGIHEKQKNEISSKEISAFIKNWGVKLGAIDVGFTIIKPHHLYSHIGRGKDYGKEIDFKHKYAIVFTVEMNHESMRYTPKGPIIMESAQQYLNAGIIAVQMAQFVRNMGFDARAHIDANYRLICPIVAQDAGLGTIGRMGLLITPKLGARVRIGVVTTNLEVEVNTNPIDSSVIHFCEICKKCASNCPSHSISTKSAKKDNKWFAWKINHEKCFTYWCKAGTDCGRCITVCPYSHPDNFIHNIIRWGIKRNPFNRWLTLRLDLYFYGEKPRFVSMKKWIGKGTKEKSK